MLVLRYLLLKHIDPLPYIQNDFGHTTLELLSLPPSKILEMCKERDIENVTYLSAIGILDIENSRFLYEYFITLTGKDLTKEYKSLSRNNIFGNQVDDITAYVIVQNRNFKSVDSSRIDDNVLARVAIADMKLFERYTPKGFDTQHFKDFIALHLSRLQYDEDPEGVDVYLKYNLAIGKLNENGWRIILSMTTEQISEYVRLLVSHGVDLVALTKNVLESPWYYQEHVNKVADGIIGAFPDADWSWLNDFTKSLGRVNIWWNTLQDI